MSEREPSAPILLSAQPSDRTLHLRPWGGTRLWRKRGQNHPQRGQPLGEAWEFSTLQGVESLCQSQELQELLGHRLPFLAKLVDVARPLSVQVHPEGPSGKEEAWIVLDAAPDAYILAGLRPGIGAKEFIKTVEYAQSAQGRQEEVFDCMQTHPVSTGSVVIIPPRTVHTIPSQVYIAEIQDPNDITYRFFDYGSNRELHPELARTHLDPLGQPRIWHPPSELNHDQLHGKRVALEMIGPGQHTVNWACGERLAVAVAGAVHVQVEQEHASIASGEMRLARRGPLRLEVSPGAMAILAWIDAPQTT